MNVISSPREGRIYLSFSKELISKNLIEILNNAKSGMYHNSFQRALLQKHPFLLLFPNLGIWESEFQQWEKCGEIVRIKAYWKFSPSHDQLFTKENIKIVREIIKNEDKQNAIAGRIKFFGRTITPDNFIEELLVLEKGDFDANDDQVTRIAGLVLAESVKLQAPIEKIPMFDFSILILQFCHTPYWSVVYIVAYCHLSL